ncbi:MAG: maleylacetoacetate isomerase [Alphaproteobacteria bacterium]|jgi:maleylacetoacetate isomerase
MILYDYWRSSSSYRVRIALHLKGEPFDVKPINLVAGEQHAPAYLKMNPQGLVPALDLENGTVLTQSLAIIEYLDECCAGAPLFPKEPEARAIVRAMANIIACDIHPLNNLRTTKYLSNDLKISDEEKDAWYKKWLLDGFTALEAMTQDNDAFLYGNSPTLADVCLIPQMYNAQRFNIDVSHYKNIIKVCNNCSNMSEFHLSRPDRYRP